MAAPFGSAVPAEEPDEDVGRPVPKLRNCDCGGWSPERVDDDVSLDWQD